VKIPSPRNTKEYLSDYERFQENPSKSFFKELFFGTTIGYRLKKMTERNGVVKGLRDQECERGNVAKRPLIPYVPVTDEVQDALNINHKERLQKIKLPNGTEFNATIWYTGTPEEFLNHVKQALHACERMGHFEEYKKALKDMGAAVRKQAKATSDLAAAKQEKLPDDIVKGFRADIETHKKEAEEAEERRAEAAEGFFSTYANLLSVEARIAWENILDRQIGTTPWTDLKGKKHKEEQKRTKVSFDDCVIHHLLTVFPYDAAEQQKYYISNVLKKPQRVSVRAFFTRVEQLNNYVKLLPSVYNSPHAGPATKLAEPFDEAELACQLLRMCPESWQNHYNVTQATVPQETRKLLLVLENIEKLFANDSKKPAANSAGTNAKTADTNGKRKGMNSSSDRIPKKKRTEKHCVLCQKHGGASASHNTSECTKYEKDGTLKSSWANKSAGTGKYSDKKKKPDGQAFAQVMDRFASKMEKTLKKATKSVSRKKKRHYDSDSDSDSE
jgi:hypothetical protein